MRRKLNPEELINATSQAQRLANFAPETTSELRKAAGNELRAPRASPTC